MDAFLKWLTQNSSIANILVGLLVGVVVTWTLMCLIAFFQGREIILWPPKIGPKVATNKSTAGDSIPKNGASKSTPINVAGNSPILLQEFPPDMNKRIEQSTDIWLLGVTLGSTIKELSPILEAKIKMGSMVRVIIRNPYGETYKLISKNGKLDDNPENIKKELYLSLDRLCRIKEAAPENFHIRLLDHMLAMGIKAVDPDRKNGRIYIEYYSYQMDKRDFPKLVVEQKDKEWYKFYRDQLQTYWNNATPWPMDVERQETNNDK